MRFITTSYLIFIVCLEAYCSYFTLSGFQECENSDALSFKDGDIALLCEGEQDEDGICKIPGFSHGVEVAFNYTVGKRPDREINAEFITVEATAFGKDTLEASFQNDCNLFDERGYPVSIALEEGEKLNGICKVPIRVFGNSLGVIGRLRLEFHREDTHISGYGPRSSNPEGDMCVTHVVQWI